MNSGFSSVSETTSPTGERIIIDAEGNRLIAASRRPDGTLRKEIRIRQGYLREEEHGRFATRGTEFRKRVEESTKVPVGFLPSDVASTSCSSTSKKKKKPKKKDEVDIPPPVFETFVSKQPSLPAKEEASPKSSEALSEEAPKSAETQSREGHNLVNRLRNVKKRLTEIEELEKKRSSGQSLTPEQNKKIARKKQIQKEILELEETLTKQEAAL